MLVLSAQVVCAQTGVWEQIDAQALVAFAANKKEYESAVGKNFWVKWPVRLCPKPTQPGQNVRPFPPRGGFWSIASSREFSNSRPARPL
jgi:hypothetical protein